ncbi:MAG: ABC-F family ATP-binding cassette domain-containing protein [Parabacteroides sp.]|nr:ABC-F family ATP-binding cassette domain-containing protein [Eubacteriales bacterium]MDD4592420.1 ABC-F family ATP-binding cassette domain-containing protein [Parabacteroides sp.]
MVILSVKDITKTYGINTILTKVSFHVNQGDRVGIVGDNGAGKSTLLSILAGELVFESGEFNIHPQLSVGYLKQKDHFSSGKTVYEEMLSIFSHIIEIEKNLESLTAEIARRSSCGEETSALLRQYEQQSHAFERMNGYSYPSEIKGILSSMAFSEEDYNKKISTLSGGERTRLALASLLLKKPDLLLLDEPTNHLDIGTLKWLEQYLKTYTGTIILISHDRYFLDQIVNRIFEVKDHQLSIYHGNYSTYLEKNQKEEEDFLRKYIQQQREIVRQEEIIRRFKQSGTEKLAKRARSREKRLEHEKRLERPAGGKSRMKVQFKEKFRTGTDVLYIEDLSMNFGEEQLFQNVNLDIKRGERICMVGSNGVGKTTLLKIILSQLAPETGIIQLGHNVVFGYYDQEQKLPDGNRTVLEELHQAYRLYNESELRGLLGRFLFRKDDVFKNVHDLSGGEKARLSLLKLMLTGANFLLMDEPTNHLDFSAKGVFENALLDFPGTLLIVSHDRYFLNKVPTRIIELSEYGIESFPGGYDYYMEKKQSISSGRNYLLELGKINNDTNYLNNSSKELRLERRRKNKELEAQQRRRERELASLETAIAKMEEEVETLEKEMCKDEVLSDHNVLLTYSQQLESTKETLEISYYRWVELNDFVK